ncbi:MAG: energy transducer TonB [Spirochaetes bacterium]|nr:energy transducer TonB [Spirochaetota bacterium]
MSFAKASSENAENSTRSKRISDAAFARFFSALLSLCILLTLYLELDLRGLIFGDPEKTQPNQDKIIQALLENSYIEKKKKRSTVKFLSDKDSEARGDITKEKGFESISNDYVLSPGQRETVQARIVSAKKYAKILTSKESRSRIAIAPEKQEQQQTPTEKLRIPAYYRWRNDFALSWDYAGRPAIPTARYAHYSYFRSMINKIQSVWAPPGGDPYPTFGDSYHRMGHASGYTRFATFPSQDIYIQFLLDDQGVVRDAKLVSSLGFQSLDRSCIEALYAAHDFGPPPKELLENGILIVPFIFRLIVR